MRKLKDADIKAVFRKGSRFETGLFRVIVKKNLVPEPGFAFVVPVSVDKRSTLRNKLRRRAREWVKNKKTFLAPGIDVVFLFKKESVKAPRKKFYEELEYAVSKIKTFR